MFYLKETHNVVQQRMPIRLQEYGVGIFIQIPTKSALKKALKKEWIRVDGKIASTATYISGGEQILLEIPEEIDKNERRLELKLKVLYEDQFLAAIHKPAGLLVSGNSFKTINRALPQNLMPSIEEDATLPHSVHRLDYPTTGILLIGKTASCIRQLNAMFEAKEVEKTYMAITIGSIKNSGEIKSDIDGKNAVSIFEKIASVASARFEQLNLLKLHPQTGRRHQLRKHLAEIGSPILGDKEYGKDGLILKGKGLYLHAYSIKFIHPVTGSEIFLKDNLPSKFFKIFPEVAPFFTSDLS